MLNRFLLPIKRMYYRRSNIAKLLLMVLFTVSLCLPFSQRTQFVSAQASAGCAVAYDIVDAWNGGYVANVTITNTGAAPINEWQLDWDFVNPTTVVNLWDGLYTQSGQAISVTNESWNPNIALGQSIVFGFQVDASGATQVPMSFVLNGETCSAESSPTVLTESCNVAYAVTDDWGSGFIGELTITNNNNFDINGWSLDFTFPGNQTAIFSWNSVYVQSGPNITFTDDGVTQFIPAGGSLDIGFQADYSGSNAEPTAFALNGVSCNQPATAAYAGLLVTPGQALLTGVGDSLVVSVQALDLDGNDVGVGGIGLDWTSSDDALLTVSDNGDGTATVTAAADFGSGAVVVSDGSAPDQVAAIPIFVAQPSSDATLISAENITFPPQNLPSFEPSDAYQYDNLTLPDASGNGGSVGPFTNAEIALFSADTVDAFSTVLEDIAPNVGDLIIAETGLLNPGTVVDVETRGAFSLVSLSITESNSFFNNGAFPVLGQIPTGVPFLEIEEPKLTCKPAGLDPEALSGFVLVTDTIFDWRNTSFSEDGFRLEPDIRIDLDVALTMPPSSELTLTCNLPKKTIPLPAFGLNAVVSPNFTLGFTDPLVITFKNDAQVETFTAIDYGFGFTFETGIQNGQGFFSGEFEEIPIEFDVTIDDAAGDQARVDINANSKLEAKVDAKVLQGLSKPVDGFIKAVCENWKKIFPFTVCPLEGRNPLGTSYKLLTVEGPLNAQFTWADVDYVIENGPGVTPSKIDQTSSVSGAWTDDAQPALDLYNTITSSNWQIPTTPLFELGPFERVAYSPLVVDFINVNLQQLNPGQFQSPNVPVATIEGDVLDVFGRTELARPVTVDPDAFGLELQFGEVYLDARSSGGSFEKIDSWQISQSVADNFDIDNEWPVSPELCDRMRALGPTPRPYGEFVIVVYNKMPTTSELATPSYLQEMKLDCSGEEVFFAVNGVQFPSSRGEDIAIVGQTCRRPDEPQVATDVALEARVKLLPSNAWRLASSSFYIDGELLESYDQSSNTTVDFYELGFIEHPYLTVGIERDLPVGDRVFRIEFEAERKSDGFIRSGVREETIEVRLKPCLEGSDIAIVFDASGSISSSEFNDMREFGRRLVNGLDFITTTTQMGIIQYASSVRTEIGLSADPALVNSTITNMNKLGGGTNTAAAITSATSMLGAGRPEAPDIMIVLTDGNSNSASATASAAAAAKNAGITVIAVGIGSGVGNTELQSIASNPGYVFTPNDFDQLIFVLEALLPAATDPIP